MNFIKIKCWYIILLGSSSAYVWYYRFDIYQLEKLNAQNLIFLLWIMLLLLPLFSEMEFLGVKVKKEVEKATEEIKDSLQSIQNQLQITNSVANNINFNNSTLPSEQKLEELLQRVEKLQSTYTSTDTKWHDSIVREDDKNVYLFKVRLSIETSLREICEKIGYVDRITISRMTQILNRKEVIDGMTCDLIYQVNKIANRGVHGEIVSEEYMGFVRKTYPEIMRQIQEASLRLEDREWNGV